MDQKPLLNNPKTTYFIRRVQNQLLTMMDEAAEKQLHQLEENFAAALEKFNIASATLTDAENINSMPYAVSKLASEQLNVAIQSTHSALDSTQIGSVANKLVVNFDEKFAALIEQHSTFMGKIDEQTNAMKVALGLQSMLTEAESKSSKKGLSMENVIGEHLSILAGIHGDEAENIGIKTDGIGKSKVGDHLVTIKLNGNEVGKIVFEDKAGHFTMSGPTSLPAQMHTASINYGAIISVGVVTDCGPKKVTTKGYLKHGTNGHIIVVDWEKPDLSGLDMIYPILRELVIANHLSKARDGNEIDWNASILLCENSLERLSNFNKLKKNLREGVAQTARNCADAIEAEQLELTSSFKQLIHSLKGMKEGTD